MTNIDKLAEIFPQCITESQDDNGKLIRAIDFELLRQILSDELVAGREAYVFDFVGKKRATSEAYKPIRKTLRPIVDRSRDFDTTKNIYIEGDNLDALKILQESYLHKVKLIYIDPPYNTGNDFIYRDDFTQDADDFDDESQTVDADGNRILNRESRGRFHSDWCAMIYSRLLLAKHFLRDDGVIFISIDDHEQANLKKMCDEIFGEKNYFALLTRHSMHTVRNSSKDFNKNSDFILVYAKDKERLTSKKNFRIREKIDKSADYKFNDNDGRGFYKLDPIYARNYAKPYTFTFQNGIVWSAPEGSFPRYSQETLSKMERTNRLDFNGKFPRAKRYLNEVQEGQPPDTILKEEQVGFNSDGTKVLAQILGSDKVFSQPKPVKLIKYLIEILPGNEDAIVMDFFSGSATTAHAVMELNAQDGGNRQFIMIQLPESTPENSEARRAGYNTICDIGEERIRRAGDKLKFDNPELDVGFRVFKVDSSNFIDMPGVWTQEILPDFVENIKPDRNALDLLFGYLLETGATIDDTLTIETLDGHDVLNYGDKILACFDKNLPEKFFRKLAKRKPDKILFRDASFASSAVKINALAYFRYIAPDTVVKVL